MRPNLLPRLHKAIPVITFTAIAMQTSVSLATEPDDAFQMIKPETRSQLWVNPGMVSYHFQQDKNFNNGNWGAGLEYRFNTVASLTAGRFYNSDRAY